MKKLIAAATIAATLGIGTPVLAHERTVNDAYDDAITHPLRLAYYVIHPLGYTAEWLFARPFQYIISREGLRNVFGWQPLDDDATYRSLRGQL